MARDNSPLPINATQLLYDMAGGKEKLTEKALSSETQGALKEIVKKNVAAGKKTIEYADYGTSADKNEDVGGGKSPTISKMVTDPYYKLKTLLGQAEIVDKGNNTYEVRDSYDFNDKGKSFGVVDDLQKRGVSPYAVVRALGRNYGSQDGQGSPVSLTVELDEQQNSEMKNKTKKGYVTGGEIGMIVDYTTKMANDWIGAATYEYKPGQPAHKLD